MHIVAVHYLSHGKSQEQQFRLKCNSAGPVVHSSPFQVKQPCLDVVSGSFQFLKCNFLPRELPLFCKPDK